MSGGGKGGEVTVGYRYHLGMHMALCHGPIDNVSEIQVDGRVAWEGLNEGTSIEVAAESLFGGDKREGGVSGTVDMEFGGSSQLANDYLTEVLPGSNPAYRGVACAVLRQCYMGNNPYLKPWSFKAQRVQVNASGGSQWLAAASGIDRPDSNCVAYTCSALDDLFRFGSYAAWPMDDPSRYATVPEFFFKYKGELDLSPSVGVGGNWLSGQNLKWSLGGALDICGDSEDREYVRQLQNPLIPSGHIFVPSYTERLDGKTWTFILKNSSAFTFDYLELWTRSSDSSTRNLNPRLAISVAGTGLLVSLSSSYAVSGFSDSVVTANSWRGLHVVTVKLDGPTGTAPDLAGNRIVWTVWVDDQPPVTIAPTDGGLTEGFLYASTTHMRPIRGGTANLAGIIYNAPHSDVWLAFTRNLSNFEPIDCDCLDMNPAHIIRECLTEPWGLGYQGADVDDDSFAASAAQLFDEDMGISILWDKEVPLEDFISEILRHIDAVLYVSRETGKFVLKLIRDDYDVGSLVTLNETNSRMASDARRPALGELTTSVTVGFTDSDQDEEEGSVTVHNEALIQLQGAVSNAKVDYPGFMTRAIASRVALRDLKALSTPLLSCDVEATRAAASLNIGDVFILDYPEQGMPNLVMRIESMSVGDGRDNTVKISCIEDAFSVPDFAAVGDVGQGWVDPVAGTPLESEPRLMLESPYYELVQRVGDREATTILTDDPDAGFLYANGGRQGNELNADLLVNAGAGYVDSGTLDFAPYAYLTLDAWYSDLKLYYTGGKDLDLLTFPALAQIGQEIVRVDSLGVDSNGSFMSVGRGVLDTVPAEHTVESPDVPIVFFSPETDNAQYTASDSVNVKLLTALGSSRLADATADTVTFASRAIRPYPPGNLEIDLESYPRNKIWDGMHSLSWAHRDRLQQTSGEIFDYTEGNIGPEAGTTYRVTADAILTGGGISADFIDVDVGSATDWEQDSNTDSNVGPPPFDADFIRFKVHSYRDGYESWQPAMVVIPFAEDVDSIGVDSIGIDSTGEEDVKQTIQTITLASAGEFDFTSIPGGYKRLVIEGQIRGAASVTLETVYAIFNADDTATNYYRQANIGDSGTSGIIANATPAIGFCPGGSSPADAYTSITIVIENYAGSAIKNAYSTLVMMDSANNLIAGFVGLHHNTMTDPITRVRIRADNHPTDGLVGTLTLYGEL